MRRSVAVLLGTGLVVAVGCGTQNYERRLDLTIQEMKYQKQLDSNLIAAPTKGKLQELHIYVRPPKDMTGPTQAFQMTVVEPGRFDVESSFIEAEKQSLHILGRVKQPKAPAKKGAAPPPESAPRGDFRAEVLELVKAAYGADVEATKLKEDSRKGNVFRTATLDPGNGKEIQVNFYGDGKTSPYEVALIFEYLKADGPTIKPRIVLCLESFAVGDKAKRLFAGGETEEEGGESSEEGAAPVAF
ncbi:hypothetical protein OJF2_12360 [Aquisphaera giovannonii]|uniref:Lipoprotein n=1 Tax=Aquisphaera giovannonii TaxID=406548 RepID=A0A5B9VWC2_9BACT|nr:hypothetical protein [Aquisphaera giovannonii]QEH32756.1 hypothetical protein OJF2_12360 [Aquisphaera giovannonii]